MLIENPPGFSIHESATIAGVWPMAPCFSNLVLFDPLQPLDSAQTVIPETAEKWSWLENYRNLVFFLRKNVRWHDGQPFTARDVKYTFDVVREAADAPARLRLNPRKEWYANVEAIEAPEPHTVVFRLNRPRPSLLLMLASGDRRPERQRQTAVVNHTRAPFDSLAVRRAVSLAMDRHAYVKGVHHDGTLVGAALMSSPQGIWGLSGQVLRALPGYGDATRDKAQARRLLAEAGFGPGKPSRVDLVTRNIAIYVDLASFVADCWAGASSTSRTGPTFATSSLTTRSTTTPACRRSG